MYVKKIACIHYHLPIYVYGYIFEKMFLYVRLYKIILIYDDIIFSVIILCYEFSSATRCSLSLIDDHQNL